MYVILLLLVLNIVFVKLRIISADALETIQSFYFIFGATAMYYIAVSF